MAQFKFLNLQTPFLVVRIWVVGSVGSVVRGSVVRGSVVRGSVVRKSVVRGSVVRGPVRVGVMRGRMVRRRRCVGSGLVMAVGRRSGSRVSGGRLKMDHIQKSSNWFYTGKASMTCQ